MEEHNTSTLAPKQKLIGWFWCVWNVMFIYIYERLVDYEIIVIVVYCAEIYLRLFVN